MNWELASGSDTVKLVKVVVSRWCLRCILQSSRPNAAGGWLDLKMYEEVFEQSQSIRCHCAHVACLGRSSEPSSQHAVSAEDCQIEIRCRIILIENLRVNSMPWFKRLGMLK